MGSNKKLAVTKVNGKQPQLVVTPPQENHVIFGMTYLKLNGSYSMSEFCSKNGKQGNESLFDMFSLMREFARKTTIDKFIDQYRSHNTKLKNNEFMKSTYCRLRNEFELYDIELIHLHMKPGGKGQPLVWGFYYDNLFEIVAFDPNHETV